MSLCSSMTGSGTYSPTPTATSSASCNLLRIFLGPLTGLRIRDVGKPAPEL